MLHRVLADAVRRNRIDGGVLRDRQLFGFTVGRAGGRNVDNTADVVFDCQAQEVDGAENIDIGIEAGFPHGAPDIHLGRMVIDHLGLFRREYALQPFGVANIDFVKTGFRVEVTF